MIFLLFSQCRYLSMELLLNSKGICKRFIYPRNLSDFELNALDLAIWRVIQSCNMTLNWYQACRSVATSQDQMMTFFTVPKYKRIETSSTKAAILAKHPLSAKNIQVKCKCWRNSTKNENWIFFLLYNFIFCCLW